MCAGGNPKRLKRVKLFPSQVNSMTRSKMFSPVVRSFVILHVVVGAALLAPCSQAEGNDAMFPAEPAAASSIGWQGNYFIIKGKPTILWSGSIHYARIPRELWRERLVEAKRAGINTIQTYVFWNAMSHGAAFSISVTISTSMRG